MGWQWGQGPQKRFPYVHLSDVLCYKPIPIIYRILLLQNSLKVIIMFANVVTFFRDSKFYINFIPLGSVINVTQFQDWKISWLTNNVNKLMLK